jgi:hypothetical protein
MTHSDESRRRWVSGIFPEAVRNLRPFSQPEARVLGSTGGSSPFPRTAWSSRSIEMEDTQPDSGRRIVKVSR